MPKTKQCTVCGIRKPTEAFYKHPTTKDGRFGKCKECAKQATRDHRAANAEHYRAYDAGRGRTARPRPAEAVESPAPALASSGGVRIIQGSIPPHPQAKLRARLRPSRLTAADLEEES